MTMETTALRAYVTKLEETLYNLHEAALWYKSCVEDENNGFWYFFLPEDAYSEITNNFNHAAKELERATNEAKEWLS